MAVADVIRQKKYLSTITVWLVFLLAIAARLLPGPRTIDDSYITYRYARNILAGKGFVYNPGERVLGTTTPLFTILLAGVGALSGGVEAPFPEIAWLISAIADGVTCILLLILGKRLGSTRAGLGAALVWAIAPFSVTFAIGGLETSLYVLFLVAVIYAHVGNYHLLAALCGALALLTRPDALILLGPMVLDRAFVVYRQSAAGSKTVVDGKNRSLIKVMGATARNLKNETLIFLLPNITWYSFAMIYFGNPLPHSIAAKTLAYHLDPASAFIRLLQHYATPFLGHLTFGNLWIGVGLVLYLFLYLAGSRWALLQTKRIWPALAFPWLYLVTFSLANPLIFRWYMTPPLPIYMLVILVGGDRLLENMLEGLRNWIDNHSNRPKPLQAISIVGRTLRVVFVILTPLLLSLKDWTLHPDHGLSRPAPTMAWYKLELLYKQASDVLAREVSPEQRENVTLAAGDVGVLGYFTGMRILDTVGLNSPQSTKYYPLDADQYIINYAIPAELILDEMPGYIVILEVYGRASLLANPLFQEMYDIMQELPTDIYGSHGMLILRRK